MKIEIKGRTIFVNDDISPDDLLRVLRVMAPPLHVDAVTRNREQATERATEWIEPPANGYLA